MNTTTTPLAIFTMGLPGSGKSTVANDRYPIGRMTVIDPDLFKEAHPDYDPKDPGVLHAWSNDKAEALLAETMASGTDMLVDGTGTNSEKMLRRMNDAKSFGYEIELLYVKVPMRVALERNANRERVVPEHIVRSKGRDISTSFEIIAPHADTVTIVENH